MSGGGADGCNDTLRESRFAADHVDKWRPARKRATEAALSAALRSNQASLINFQVTAFPLCGGMVFPFAIGAVVDGESWDSQMPLSGQVSPVLAVVPTPAMLSPFVLRSQASCQVIVESGTARASSNEVTWRS